MKVVFNMSFLKLEIKHILLMLITVLLVFISVFIFFSYIRPIVAWDGDDWGTLSINNGGILPFGWHNGRILPFDWDNGRVLGKLLGGISGNIAAFLIRPLCGDYLFSITITCALVISIFTTLFYLTAYKFFRSITNVESFAIFAGLILLLLYFVIFKVKENNNLYMLWCVNLCTEFYYVLPNIINSTFVLWFMAQRINENDISIDRMGHFSIGVLVCALYLDIFSMLWSCMILFVFSVYESLFGFWKLYLSVKKSNSKFFLKYLAKYRMNILIGVFFIIYSIIEVTSGRAKELQKRNSSAPGENIITSAKELFVFFNEHINKTILIGSCIIAVIYLTSLIYQKYIKSSLDSRNISEKKKLNSAIFICFICFFTLGILYILTASLAGLEYINRIDCIYGIFFFAIMAVILCGIYIVLIFPKTSIIVPLVAMFLFGQLSRQGNSI
jgi:hypothetical protein